MAKVLRNILDPGPRSSSQSRFYRLLLPIRAFARSNEYEQDPNTRPIGIRIRLAVKLPRHLLQGNSIFANKAHLSNPRWYVCTVVFDPHWSIKVLLLPDSDGVHPIFHICSSPEALCLDCFAAHPSFKRRAFMHIGIVVDFNSSQGVGCLLSMKI